MIRLTNILHLSTSSNRQQHFQTLKCSLTKQGSRFITSLATAQEPTNLLRKFVASNTKHVALTTLSHLLSQPRLSYLAFPVSASSVRPTLSHLLSQPRLSYLAFPLYSIIREQTWFSWNSKLVAELIASLYKLEMFEEAESLFEEAVSKLGRKERDLCVFYCSLVDSHAKNKCEEGFLDGCTRVRELVSVSCSVYVKQKGYEAMVAGYCEIGMPKKGEEMIDEMREMGLKVSGFEYKSLVYSYGQMGFFEDMKRGVVWMEKEGFELDTVCCNMVLSSFGAHGELLGMASWLKKMRDSGIVFTVRTYNSVLNSCPSILLLLGDLKSLPLSINVLLENLRKEEADIIQELLKSTVLDQVTEWKSSELKLDLHGMHLGTAYLILLQWFDKVKERCVNVDEPTPTEILVVCGCGKHSSTRGESPVKKLAKEIIVRMKCPLKIDRKNIGCFICKGRKFKEWLCDENAKKVLSENVEAEIQ